MEPGNKPLYALIIDDIKRKIEEGMYTVHQQIPTEMELAYQFGVSRITSKRALLELERGGYIYRKRGSGSYVKERAGDKEPFLGGTSSAPQRIISMILPYMAANGHLDYMRGATEYLESKGYYLSIHCTDWNPEKEKELLTRLPKHGFSGIILYPISSIHNMEVLNLQYIDQYPIVTMDQYYDSIPVPSVCSDNFRGGYIAAQRLIELGHRRIAFVSSIGIEYRSSVRDRYFGYCQALKDGGLPSDAELVITDFYRQVNEENKEAFYTEMIQFLLGRKATAIQAEHDELALDLLKVCLGSNIQVPEQLSLVGFDDEEVSRHFEVPLATVLQNKYEIGRRAAEAVIDLLEERKLAVKRMLIPIMLQERQSIGPLAGERLML
ncbi:GntR family transcriptional regulator [Paenibacillus thiaminolyticus]|uniref:GntR family transcriptional regulator n=2 Tax=Paenibacillus thiaminolyticus TaxID=49283 RepID=A0AAP9DXR0_PANTH|nr:substrate-binding domain-containing protein [Paenibacillus thiaminolyticus]MEC0062191.1 substrate-binding domain-containing protein [Paenibacillus thiaminolyticus]MEC0102609.1 substrate-binding domain-containing protein [Paenibacillus thiaminolyticus]QDM46242.1 GntR family transcriptional regulator [Paenibacillus thiaminolyticus]SUA49289.1 GntR family transcriptional regulator with LacI sensor [Paenibacillus thiaminolyticus]